MRFGVKSLDMVTYYAAIGWLPSSLLKVSIFARKPGSFQQNDSICSPNALGASWMHLVKAAESKSVGLPSEIDFTLPL